MSGEKILDHLDIQYYGETISENLVNPGTPYQRLNSLMLSFLMFGLTIGGELLPPRPGLRTSCWLLYLYPCTLSLHCIASAYQSSTASWNQPLHCLTNPNFLLLCFGKYEAGTTEHIQM